MSNIFVVPVAPEKISVTPIIMDNQGLPRNGLVALYDIGKQIQLGNTGQTLVDFSGRGNSAQLGYTAGADTNDPAYSGQGLVFGADDRVRLSTMPDIDITKNFTIIIVANVGTVERKCMWSNGVGLDNRMAMGVSDGGSVGIETYNGSAYNRAIGLTVSNNQNIILMARCSNNTLSICANGGFYNTNSLLIGAAPVSGSYLGYSENGPLYFDTGKIYCFGAYNRVLSDSECLKSYSYLKRLMQSRGVVI